MQPADQIWILFSAALVFLMQAGFMAVEAGLTRSKNSINVAIKNISDFGVSIFLYWAVGFGLMFGPSLEGWIGADYFLFDPGADTTTATFFVFHAMFCGTATTIVSGAVAERMRFHAYLLVAVIISLIIYPLFGHWAWGSLSQADGPGWLEALGFRDFAGSTVVHSVGGWVALAAILLLGPRAGRFPENGRAQRFNGSNLPLTALGVLVLWFGWFGFNGGSTGAFNDSVPQVIGVTLMGGVAGIVGALLFGWTIAGKPYVLFPLNGCLAGLVSVTASAASISLAEAALVGAIGGVLTVSMEALLDRLRLDDAVGAIPVHLGAGMWGTLAVALFADPVLLDTGLTRWEQLGVQAAGIAACGLIAFPVSYIILATVNNVLSLRVSANQEKVGLNISEHNANTDLRELLSTLHAQAESQDLSVRAPQDPFTETGQIGLLYNQVIYELEQSTTALQQEHQRAEGLLHNILPATIAQRLKQGEREPVDSYTEATVLFGDIVGFSEMAEEVGGVALVHRLNRIFSELDRLTASYSAEKIKTIGDCYMVVAGVPEPKTDHARLIADLALDIQAQLSANRTVNDLPIRMRIGIHSGPVVAGVIGEQRFLYDLWGDTVNTASRMESHGLANAIQLTPETYQRIKTTHRCEPRGVIDVKGKGMMETYWLLGRQRPANSARKPQRSLDGAA